MPSILLQCRIDWVWFATSAGDQCPSCFAGVNVWADSILGSQSFGGPCNTIRQTDFGSSDTGWTSAIAPSSAAVVNDVMKAQEETSSTRPGGRPFTDLHLRGQLRRWWCDQAVWDTQWRPLLTWSYNYQSSGTSNFNGNLLKTTVTNFKRKILRLHCGNSSAKSAGCCVKWRTWSMFFSGVEEVKKWHIERFARIRGTTCHFFKGISTDVRKKSIHCENLLNLAL